MLAAFGQIAPPRKPDQTGNATRPMTEPTFIAVARLADLPPGGKKCVTVEGQKVLLCNTKDRIFAGRKSVQPRPRTA